MRKNDFKIKSDSFDFTQLKEKIYDQKFETKPIGYFKDAMLRFGKNKGNVIATFILASIILLAIIVPIATTKNYSELESQIAHLPPRIPLLEKLGIFDGREFRTGITVDKSTVDPETGIGFPKGVDKEFIVEGTLVNRTEPCALDSEDCVGGETVLKIDGGSNNVSIVSNEPFFFNHHDNPVLTIDIYEFENEGLGAVNIYIQSVFEGEFELVGTIKTAGVHSFNPLEVLNIENFLSSLVKLEFVSEEVRDTVIVQSIQLFDDSQVEAIREDEGFVLSEYAIHSGAGSVLRQNGILHMADFLYLSYHSAFGTLHIPAMPSSQFNALIEEYGDKCSFVVDPNNPQGRIFADTCPIEKTYGQTESVIVDGESFYSYIVDIDYMKFAGYDTLPFYLFGTSAAGHDVFSLIFVGVRTSLLIGFIVAAINITIGILVGSVAGYYGGVIDATIQRFSEILGRVPWLIMLAIFIAFFGPGIRTLILILIISGWIGIGYLTRTQFYRFKGREYVLAARTLGAKDARLIFRHILPNGIGTIITASILMVPGVIFTEATLSFLGFGIGHGQSFNFFGLTFSGVSIGVLLSDGRVHLATKPYLTAFPAAMIAVLMITFNMFGNALRDAFNPALRGS